MPLTDNHKGAIYVVAAPEVLTSARYDAKLADIWSAGVMLYTMLCCSYPFEKQEDDPKDLRTQTKIMQRIMRGDFALPEWIFILILMITRLRRTTAVLVILFHPIFCLSSIHPPHALPTACLAAVQAVSVLCDAAAC